MMFLRPLAGLLLAALIAPLAAAQSSSSLQIPGVSPGGVVKKGDGVFGQDSRRNGTAAGVEGPSGTPVFGSNEYCPPNKVWGEPYGVLYCLSTAERCQAEFLTWSSTDGRSLCKAYAPATSAIKLKPVITYRGVVVAKCPEGASRAECVETVQTTQSEPITLSANPQVSAGFGSAAASCISGAWSIANSVCSGGGTTTQQPCASGTVSWTVGSLTCSATAPAAESGQSATLADSVGPSTGTAQAVCIGGTWGGLSGQTCSSPPPSCPATNMTWGTYCTGSLPQTATGSSYTASGANGSYSGAATYSCVNGAWTGPTAASCSAKCYSQGGAWQWQQGGAICEGTLPSGYVSPGTITVTDNHTSATDQATGSYSVTCRPDGTWDQANQVANCTAMCSSDGSLQSWMASNGQVCRGYLPAGPVSAGTYTVNSIASDLNTGTYKATCRSDGVWDLASAVATCAPPCPAIPGGGWTQNGATCYGDVPASKAGTSVTVSDTTAPVTGSYTGFCQADGSWRPGATSMSCQAKCTTPGGDIPYGNCAYTSPPSGTTYTQGQSVTMNDSIGPYKGSASLVCDATGGFQLQGTPTCDITCTSPGGSISAGNCTYTMPAAGTNYTQGQYAYVSDSIGPWTGSGSFICGSDGNFQYISSTCNAPACSGGYQYWSGCSGYVGTTQHGGYGSASNSAANYTGSASFYCNAGSFQYAGGSCTYSPPAASCYVPAGPYDLGVGCVYQSYGTSISSGSSAYFYDSSPPGTGYVQVACNDGSMSFPSYTCN